MDVVPNVSPDLTESSLARTGPQEAGRRRTEALGEVHRALRHLAVAQALVHRTQPGGSAEQPLADVRAGLRAAERALRLQQDVVDHGPVATPDEAMAAVLPTAILTTDRHGAVLRANHAALHLFELGPTHAQHKPLFAYITTDRRRPVRALLSRCVRSAQPTDTRVDLKLRSGREVSCHAWLTPHVTAAAAGAGPATVGTVRWVLEPEGSPTGEAAAHAALVELCRLGVVDADLRSMLGRVCVLVAAAVAGADDASILIGDPEAPALIVDSSGRAQAADGLQVLAGQGPSLDAFGTARPVVVGDLGADARWPELAVRVPEAGVRSVVAVPLRGRDDGPADGVLTVYARTPGVLALPAVHDTVLPFAAAAQKLVHDSRLVSGLVATRDQLREALLSRAVIDQAKGIVMASRGCDADEAFQHLRRLSNAQNRKLRVIAQALVDAVRAPGP